MAVIKPSWIYCQFFSTNRQHFSLFKKMDERVFTWMFKRRHDKHYLYLTENCQLPNESFVGSFVIPVLVFNTLTAPPFVVQMLFARCIFSWCSSKHYWDARVAQYSAMWSMHIVNVPHSWN